MKLRVPVVVLFVAHCLGWIGATVQAVSLQVGSGGVSDDALLFGGFGVFFAALTGVLAYHVARGRQVALILTATAALLAGAIFLLVGTPMLVLGAIGPADPYIAPVGGIGVVVGSVHLGAGVCSLMAFLQRKQPREAT